MTFWSLTNSDFSMVQTLHQFHDHDNELDHHRIMSGFHGAFATGVASQQGTLTLPDTWFRHNFCDLLVLQLLRPDSSNLPCLYSTFPLEFPSVLSRVCLSCCYELFFICVRLNQLDLPECPTMTLMIELFCGVDCVVTLPFWHFCWCRGFCHRTESDLFLFLLKYCG